MASKGKFPMNSLHGSTNFFWPRRPDVLMRSLWKSRMDEPADVLYERFDLSGVVDMCRIVCFAVIGSDRHLQN